MSTTRLIWPDISKGIGIVLVVYGHVYRGLMEDNLLPSTGLWLSIDAAIYSFHMALFFAISGYFAAASVRKGFVRTAQDKLITIAWPYVLWSVLHISVLALSKGNTPDLSPATLGHMLYTPVAHYWFLFSLLWCSIIYALIHRAPAIILIALAIALNCLHLYLQSAYSATAYYFMYFMIGVLLAKGQLPRISLAGIERHRILILISASALFLVVFNTWPRTQIIPNFFTLLILASSGMAAVISLSLIISRTTGNWLKTSLTYLGRQSMAIYVMHVMAGAATRQALLIAGINNGIIHLVIGIIIATGASLIAAMLLYRLGINRWFGLR